MGWQNESTPRLFYDLKAKRWEHTRTQRKYLGALMCIYLFSSHIVWRKKARRCSCFTNGQKKKKKGNFEKTFIQSSHSEEVPNKSRKWDQVVFFLSHKPLPALTCWNLANGSMGSDNGNKPINACRGSDSWPQVSFEGIFFLWLLRMTIEFQQYLPYKMPHASHLLHFFVLYPLIH